MAIEAAEIKQKGYSSQLWFELDEESDVRVRASLTLKRGNVTVAMTESMTGDDLRLLQQLLNSLVEQHELYENLVRAGGTPGALGECHESESARRCLGGVDLP